jgi:uncharacterized protein
MKNKNLERKIFYSLREDVLNLTILPTEQCNFRCFYCYESFKLGKMKKEISEAILKLIKKRASSLKILHIDWFGGEPLMAQDIVVSLSQQFKALSEKFGFEYSASITTNGYYLDSNLFEKLVDNGISSYQITLDGDKKRHNRTRMLSNGEGTFDKIWSNLIAIKERSLDFDITLRIHYSPENLKDIKTFAKLLEREFGRDDRFKIFFKNISTLGSCNDESLSTFNREESDEIQKDLNSLVDNIDTVTFDDYLCYASEANSFIIRSNGDVSKCTVALDEEVNIVGKLNSYGELELNQDKCKLWSIGLQTEDKEHLACPYYSLIKPKIVDMVD